jgi:hypothetical protein
MNRYWKSAASDLIAKNHHMTSQLESAQKRLKTVEKNLDLERQRNLENLQRVKEFETLISQALKS